jgi:haloalkane dehalogenase/tRNA(adenine34) deaminase
LVQALRTPDDRFQDLHGWAYAPFYHQRTDGLRLHYVDTGPRHAARTWLCLHGQPTWSYPYRRMMPVFAMAGHRVIAPDFAGFGRSDKPVDDNAYTFDFHRRSLIDLVEALDLRDIALVVQDWGGLIGLTLPMAMPDRFTALLVMNTTLGTGDEPLGQGFLDWRDFSNRNSDMDVARLMKRACPHIGDEEATAYAAPYLDASYKAGVRAFPNLVPDRPDAPGARLLAQRLDRQEPDGGRHEGSGARPVDDAVVARPHQELSATTRDRRGWPFPAGMGRRHRAQGG